MVLQGLVEKGNTVITIEHNLDVIKSADWIVDLGPDGGSGGGRIIASGTPEQVAKSTESHTATFLAEILGLTRTADDRRSGRRMRAVGVFVQIMAAKRPEVTIRDENSNAGGSIPRRACEFRAGVPLVRN